MAPLLFSLYIGKTPYLFFFHKIRIQWETFPRSWGLVTLMESIDVAHLFHGVVFIQRQLQRSIGKFPKGY